MPQPIDELEHVARQLEPAGDERERLTEKVVAHAARYLADIADAPSYGEDSDRGTRLRATGIPEDGIGIDRVLELLDAEVDRVGIATTSGRFLGYIPGGALYYSALGDYLAAVANCYSGYFFASPGAVRMENQLIGWMAGVVGYPDTTAGTLTSGGSLANLTSIATARESADLFGAEIARAVVYRTEHAHHCIDRAIQLTGLRDTVQRFVPTDAHYRMNADALERQIRADRKAGLRPWLLIGSAGTTNTGAVDPLSELAALAREHEMWFHVDGAYGAFFALTPEGRERLEGMEKSDSLVLDPHKTLFLPYGTGAVLVRDRTQLLAANDWEADYTQDAPEDLDELSPSQLGPEMTRHFRGLRLWLPLVTVGIAPFRAALSEKLALARYAYERLGRIDGIELGPVPDLSVVVFRCLPPRGDADAFNLALTRRIQRGGRVFLTSTRVEGRVVLRFAIVSFRTHRDDVDEAVRVLQESVSALTEEAERAE